MQWIIRLTELNKYAFSKKIFVDSPLFAKKFTDKKSALQFLQSPKFANIDFILVNYDESSKTI